MGNIFISSDPHFCHSKSFLYEPRGFKNEWDMNKQIIENWNSVVDMDDDAYILGDIMLNNNEEGIKCLKSLKGRIHIIRGNHDSDARIQLYKDCYNVVEVCDGKFLNYNNYHFYLSHFPCIVSNYNTDKPLKARMISVCGHTHTKNWDLDLDKGLIFHAELDTHSCYPWRIETIIEYIKNYLKNKGEKV